MNKVKLSEVANVELSSIDKKIVQGERSVKLCNFTDVYYNWAITKSIVDKCMEGSVNESEFSKFALRKGQVAITKDSETRSDIGMSTYISEDFDDVVLAYHCALITPKEGKVNGKYLNALLNDSYGRKYFANQASGSGQRYTLSKEAIESIKIPLPSMEKQNAIGSFFSNIDRKIELNNRINDNLYKQLELLYKYWFTQFDFPNTFGKPYRSSGGALTFHDSLKRNLPNSWKLASLGSLCSFRNGINYDKNSLGTKNYHIVNVRNITASTIIINEDECDAISLYPSHADKYVVSDDDIVIARSGTPGATRLLLNPSDHVIFCGFIICCTPYNRIMRNYLWCWIKQFEGTASTQTGGSILQNVSQDTLKSLPVVIPPEDVLLAFNKQMDSIIKAIDNNMRESNQLLRYRNWILPMLMNGQATISD